MTRTLDLSKPYGTVQGTGVAYRHEQDGRFFDGVGNEVTEDGAKVGAASASTDTGAVATTIQTDDGLVVLDGMEGPQLHALAKTLGVKVHPAAGVPKVTAALVAAFPVQAGDADQLNAQLNG